MMNTHKVSNIIAVVFLFTFMTMFALAQTPIKNVSLILSKGEIPSLRLKNYFGKVSAQDLSNYFLVNGKEILDDKKVEPGEISLKQTEGAQNWATTRFNGGKLVTEQQVNVNTVAPLQQAEVADTIEKINRRNCKATHGIYFANGCLHEQEIITPVPVENKVQSNNLSLFEIDTPFTRILILFVWLGITWQLWRKFDLSSVLPKVNKKCFSIEKLNIAFINHDAVFQKVPGRASKPKKTKFDPKNIDWEVVALNAQFTTVPSEQPSTLIGRLFRTR